MCPLLFLEKPQIASQFQLCHNTMLFRQCLICCLQTAVCVSFSVQLPIWLNENSSLQEKFVSTSLPLSLCCSWPLVLPGGIHRLQYKMIMYMIIWQRTNCKKKTVLSVWSEIGSQTETWNKKDCTYSGATVFPVCASHFLGRSIKQQKPKYTLGDLQQSRWSN